MSLLTKKISFFYLIYVKNGRKHHFEWLDLFYYLKGHCDFQFLFDRAFRQYFRNVSKEDIRYNFFLDRGLTTMQWDSLTSWFWCDLLQEDSSSWGVFTFFLKRFKYSQAPDFWCKHTNSAVIATKLSMFFMHISLIQFIPWTALLPPSPMKNLVHNMTCFWNAIRTSLA